MSTWGRKQSINKNKELIVNRFYKRSISTKNTQSSEKYLKLKYSNDGFIPRKNGTPQYRYSEFWPSRKIKSRSLKRNKKSKINFEIKGDPFADSPQKDCHKDSNFSFA